MRRTVEVSVDVELDDTLLQQMNAALQRRRGGSVTYSVDFGEGYQADITAVPGTPGYVDGVLFWEGREIAVCEPGDAVEGEYIWWVGGGKGASHVRDEFILIIS